MSFEKPNLSQLIESLGPVKADWKELGIYLNISHDELTAIDRDELKSNDKLREVCEKWLQRNPDGNWKDIITQLKKMERHDVIKTIKSKFLAPQSETTIVSAATAMNPVNHDTEENTIDVRPFNTPLITLHGKFIFTLSELQTGLNRQLQRQKVHLEQLARFINMYLEAPMMEVPSATDIKKDPIHDMFSQIMEYLNCFDTSLLHSIDLNYLQMEFTGCITSYENHLDTFMKDRSIIELKQLLKSHSINEEKGAVVHIILKLGDYWNKRNHRNLDNLIKHLFGNHTVIMKITKIHHSILTIVCQAPEICTLAIFMRLAKQRHLFKMSGIHSIQIGKAIWKMQYTDPADHVSESVVNFQLEQIYFLDRVGVNITDSLASQKMEPTDLPYAVKFNIEMRLIHEQSKKGENMPIQSTCLVFQLLQSSHALSLWLKLGLDPNHTIEVLGKSYALLSLACILRKKHSVFLLLHHGANPDIACNYIGTPLFVVAEGNNPECLSLLLRWKANPNIQIFNGATPLYIACQCGYTKCADLLLKANADPSIDGGNGDTALYVASQNGHHDCLSILLKAKANPNAGVDNGTTPVYIATQNGHPKCLDLLLKAKANPNIQASNGTTALHRACQKGYYKCASLLLRAGADLKIQLANQYGAFDFIVGYDQPSLVQLLTEHGVNLNENIKWLFEAILQERQQLMEEMIKNGATVNNSDENGLTPLMVASMKNNSKILQVLLENGADVMKTDMYGRTAYDISVQYKNTSISKLLQARQRKEAIKKDSEQNNEIKEKQLHLEHLEEMLLQKKATLVGTKTDTDQLMMETLTSKEAYMQKIGYSFS